MGKTPHKLLLLVGIAVLTGACAREAQLDAEYSLDQCRRLALIDAASGMTIRGAEDFALDGEHGRLFISAYDRRAVEKAAKKRRDELPQGGVYAAALSEIFDHKTTELKLASLAAPGDFAGGLRPHGIAYDANNRELLFINRTYVRHGRKWKMVPKLQRIGANGEMFVGEAATAHCAANDVAAMSNRVFTSFDHGSCGAGAAFENIFRLKRSGVADNDRPVYSRAAFANGIAEIANGELALAATRESAVIILAAAEGELDERARIALPGRPDNLTVSADGAIIAAVHPSMRKLAANRKFGIGKSPSRIVRAMPDGGPVTVLFDDPKATLFSAATVGLETERGLIAGSVTDDGLLVCQAGL